MVSIQAKYKEYRKIAKDGDVVLVENPHALGKTIKFCDKAKWTHAFIVKWETIAKVRRLILAQEGFEGANISFIGNIIGMYSDMIVLRPLRSNTVIDNALCDMINIAEGGKDYAYKGGLAGLIERFCKNYLWGWKIKLNWGRKNQLLCSQWDQLYSQKIYINDFDRIWRMFPQDFMRFYNEENFTIIKF